ncbi:MAG TPA: hypothetical protein VJ824_12175 [Bacillota bacterium]|nr:hypothetical protein [Bacillota bacterium]
MAQATKRPEIISTTPVNVFDTMWDGWLNSVKIIHGYQREMEGVTKQAVERQKDIWQQTRENLEKLETEVNKFINDAKANLLENVKNVNGETVSKNMDDWSKRSEEVVNKIQQLYGTPGKACGSLIGKSLDQLESTMVGLMSQQQKSREEVQTLLENFTDQVKKTNKGLIESWETNRSTAFNIFK